MQPSLANRLREQNIAQVSKFNKYKNKNLSK